MLQSWDKHSAPKQEIELNVLTPMKSRYSPSATFPRGNPTAGAIGANHNRSVAATQSEWIDPKRIYSLRGSCWRSPGHVNLIWLRPSAYQSKGEERRRGEGEIRKHPRIATVLRGPVLYLLSSFPSVRSWLGCKDGSSFLGSGSAFGVLAGPRFYCLGRRWSRSSWAQRGAETQCSADSDRRPGRLPWGNGSFALVLRVVWMGRGGDGPSGSRRGEYGWFGEVPMRYWGKRRKAPSSLREGRKHSATTSLCSQIRRMECPDNTSVLLLSFCSLQRRKGTMEPSSE